MTAVPRRRPILIAHAAGDDEHAAQLAAPLAAAGYEVVHQGTVLVGESLVAEASRVLAAGGPVVLCGTTRAAGSRWAHRLVHATRRYAGVRVFGMEMEQDVYLEPLTLDAEVAAYWLDPDRAVRELLAALARHYPLDPSAEPVDEAVARAEAAYRNLLLTACNIIPLTSLPPDRRLATRQLMLRTLFAPLTVRVEREAGDAAGADLLDSIERRRAVAHGAVPASDGAGSDRSHRLPTEARRPRAVTVGPGERLQASRRLIVLGDPGAGKSTMLRWMATAYLLRLRGDPDWPELPAVETLPDEDWLPILIRCRDLSGDQLNGSLADMLTHVLRRAELPDDQVAALQSSLPRRLGEGTALLLVDGLDEIADATARTRFCEQLERIHLAYPAAPVVVTSRIVGYREMGYRIGRGFEHVTLAELDRKDKDDFIRRWCAVTEPSSQQKEVAAEIIKDIHGTDRIERLTGNPMLLTTMALVKRTVGKLPEHRAELYRAAIGVLLNWRPEVDSPVEYREAVPQLGYLAYDMSSRGVQQIADDDLIALLGQMRAEHGGRLHAITRHTPPEFIRLMENRTGLLTEAGRVRDAPVYEFRHLTFQEYLTALALVERRFPGRDPDRTLAGDIAGLAARLDDHASADSSADKSWQEAVRLAVTICPDDDVDPALEAILGPDERDPQAAAPRTVLAARCLQDEPNAGPAIVRRVLQRLVQALPPDGRDLDLHDVVRSLADSRWSGELIALLLTEVEARSGHVSPDLVALLGEVISRAAPDTPGEREAWQQARVDDLAAEARETVLRAVLIVGHGAFGDERAAERLLRLLDHADGLLSGAAAWALGRLIEESATCAWRLTDDQADAIRRAVDPAAVPRARLVLLARVLHPRRWPEAVGPLLAAAEDSSPRVREAAVRLLGDTQRDSVTATVTARLQDEITSVRVAAVRALGKLRPDGAVPALLSCLGDGESEVRGAAATALGRIGDRRAVPALISVLQEDAGELAAHAAPALGELGHDHAVPALLDGLSRSSDEQAWSFVLALGRLASADAVPQLLDRLANEPPDLEGWLSWALGDIGDTRVYEQVAVFRSTKLLSTLTELGGTMAFEQILDALRNGDAEQREDAVVALQSLSDDRATQAIVEAAGDDAQAVRHAVAQVLRRRPDRRILSQLLALLEDSDVPTRIAAVAALGGYPDHTVFEVLVPLLTDPDPRLRIAVAEALRDHFDPRPVAPLVDALADPVAEVREGAAQSLGSQGDRTPIRRLVTLLDDPDPDVRSTAAGSLGELGAGSSLGGLVRMLSTDDAGERVWAAYALGELRAAAAVPALVGALADPIPKVRKWAAIALSNTGGGPAVEALLGRLGDDNLDVRVEVHEALARLRDPRAHPSMANSLRDPCPRVRAAAATAIGDLGSVASTYHLLPYLRDENWRVREAVCWSLGKLDAADSFPALVTATADPHSAVQASAAWALGMLGDTAALDPLRRLATSPIGRVRANAVEALARTAPDEMRPMLLGVLRSDHHPQAREAVAWGLRLHPDPDYVAALLARLNDHHRSVRGATAVALGGSGDPETAEPLRAGLDDPSLWVRGRVACALAHLNDGSAVGPLSRLSGHVDPWLAARACWALSRLGDRGALAALRPRMPAVAGADRRNVVTVLADGGDAYARRLTRNGLRHPAAGVRRAWLDSLSWTRSDLLDHALLTRDGDGKAPYFDVATTVDERRVAMMARRLHRSPQEIRTRYQALAKDVPLVLSMGAPPPTNDL